MRSRPRAVRNEERTARSVPGPARVTKTRPENATEEPGEPFVGRGEANGGRGDAKLHRGAGREGSGGSKAGRGRGLATLSDRSLRAGRLSRGYGESLRAATETQEGRRAGSVTLAGCGGGESPYLPISPASSATRVSPATVRMPSFRIRLSRWVSTVR
jgi:hypothetical protein